MFLPIFDQRLTDSDKRHVVEKKGLKGLFLNNYKQVRNNRQELHFMMVREN